jgi:16S rRNA processing protein RimM
VHKTDASSDAKNDLILMAEIVGVHGIKGWVKLKIFSTDPENLADYAPFCDAKQTKTFDIESIHPHGNTFLATLAGVTDRTAAEKLQGSKLYLTRDRLPDIDENNTFYHVDLVGLAAKWPDGRPMGKVTGVANFGAGDLLEIRPSKGASFYVPFTNDAVPDVDMQNKTVTVNPPPGLLD